MPTRHGESAVIRILPKDRGILEVSKLGLSVPDQSKLKRLLIFRTDCGDYRTDRKRKNNDTRYNADGAQRQHTKILL